MIFDRTPPEFDFAGYEGPFSRNPVLMERLARAAAWPTWVLRTQDQHLTIPQYCYTRLGDLLWCLAPGEHDGRFTISGYGAGSDEAGDYLEMGWRDLSRDEARWIVDHLDEAMMEESL